MSESEIHTERLTEYSLVDAVGIGRSMPFLSERLSDDPMNESVLRAITYTLFKAENDITEVMKVLRVNFTRLG